MITGVKQAYILLCSNSILISFLLNRMEYDFMAILFAGVSIFYAYMSWMAGRVLEQSSYKSGIVDVMNDNLDELPEDIRDAVKAMKEKIQDKNCGNPHCSVHNPLTANTEENEN